MADFRIPTNAPATPAGRVPAATNGAAGEAVGADTPLVAADNNAAVARNDWASGNDDGLDGSGLDFDLGAGLSAMSQVQALDHAAEAHLAAARADMAIGDTASAARELQAAAKDLELEAELLMRTPPTQPGGGGTATSPWTVKTAALTSNNTFSSIGDPHETTGDGLKFDNQKTGNFTLLKSASGDFEVQNMQEKDEKGRWKGATLNKQVAVKDGSDVVFYDGKTGQLQVNGKAAPLPSAGNPIRLPGGGRVEKTADGIKVITHKQDVVSVAQRDGYIDISGKLGQRTDGEVRGGLGAFEADGDQGNDFKPRTGDGVMGNPKDPAVVDKFEEEWRVPAGQGLIPAPQAQQPGGGGVELPPMAPEVAEALARARDEQDFAKADVNKDGILSGTEAKGYEKYAKNSFIGSNGQRVIAVTHDDFMAGRAAERAKTDDKRLTERQAIAKDLKDFDKLDRNQDGHLSGPRTYNKVKQYDANDDGKVTREEFLAGKARERADARFKELDKDGDGKLAGGELKDKFKRYDLNQDGVVDAHEFRHGRMQDTHALRDEMEFDRLDRTKDGFLTGERTVKKWKKYDENHDGKISKEEFLKGRAGERIERAFERRDGNQDTVLSGTEMPATADANGDEMVTREEFRKWREAQDAARADEKAFQAMDRNRDGELTGTQTYAKVKQYDANNDGVVTHEEFMAGKAKEREDA